MIMRLGASDLPIRFESVSIGSRGIAILDRIMLQIEAEPPTVLVGPNGSGKTTLLRTAMGLVSPTQGRITWAGVEKIAARAAGDRLSTPSDASSQCQRQSELCVERGRD